MKSIKLAAALATTLALTLITGSVFAQEPATPNVEKRQDRQQKRIAKGVESGALTAKEASNLEKREAKIEGDKQAAKADGVVTPAERAKLEHEENRASKKIRNKKHNASAVTTTN
ncbi:hypothetical protein UNDYM_3464 [Undibacterium sp. YM2]|jgi:hypothetical protein|uniref:hypothetical protein n=1 Tax=Undibacterium sp. YM2 TaxID=2058625 RepID=UPI001331D857|nr:hypothetical protein [Undibacterium sp. YM2]BBB67717.1 hypothetical protein UNDYM_3464 [Undibacterium sp. YM2]